MSQARRARPPRRRGGPVPRSVQLAIPHICAGRRTRHPHTCADPAPSRPAPELPAHEDGAGPVRATTLVAVTSTIDPATEDTTVLVVTGQGPLDRLGRLVHADDPAAQLALALWRTSRTP